MVELGETIRQVFLHIGPWTICAFATVAAFLVGYAVGLQVMLNDWRKRDREWIAKWGGQPKR